jgi:hypothetical protein
MNATELAAIKRLMVVINSNPDRRCPICHDVFSATVSNLKPVWSDYFDNIVCVDCAATTVRCVVCLTDIGASVSDDKAICSHCEFNL